MAYNNITAKKEKAVGVITLDRPDALNALCEDLIDEMAQALDDFETDPKIGCILLIGSKKAFAAGADIKEMQSKGYMDAYLEDFITRNWERLTRCRKPVIAAVSGYALGGGCELAMMCDFIIAADTAKFGQPEINLGVIAGIGGTQRLTRLVGKSKSMDMHLTGRFMDAEEAERAGLVSRVVPAKKLMEEAQGAAQKIAEKSMLATVAAKEAVNRAEEVSLSEGLLFEKRLFQSLFASEDQKEGMAAFQEKREAQFRDK